MTVCLELRSVDWKVTARVKRQREQPEREREVLEERAKAEVTTEAEPACSDYMKCVFFNTRKES